MFRTRSRLFFLGIFGVAAKVIFTACSPYAVLLFFVGLPLLSGLPIYFWFLLSLLNFSYSSRRLWLSFLTCPFDVSGQRVLPPNGSLSSSHGDPHFRGCFRYLSRRCLYYTHNFFSFYFSRRSDFYGIVFSFVQLVRNERDKFLCSCKFVEKRFNKCFFFLYWCRFSFFAIVRIY